MSFMEGEVGAPVTKKLQQSDGADADEDTQPAMSSIRGNYTSVYCYIVALSINIIYTVCLSYFNINSSVQDSQSRPFPADRVPLVQ